MTGGVDRQNKPLGDVWILDIERGNWRKVRLNFTIYIVIIVCILYILVVNPRCACVRVTVVVLCVCVCVCVCVCSNFSCFSIRFFSQPTILTGFSYAFLRFYFLKDLLFKCVKKPIC